MNLKNKYNYEQIVSFILYLLPICLLTGPMLPNLIVTILSVGFIWYLFRFKKKEYFNNRFFYFFMTFCFILIVSSLISDHLIWSLRSSISYLRYIFFILLIYYVIKNNSKFLKIFQLSIFLLLIIVTLDALIQKFVGFNIFGFKSPSDLKLTSFLGDEPILGTYFLRIFSILFLIALITNKNCKLLLGLFYLIVIPLIFYSGQRTIFYLSLLFIPFFLIFIKHNKLNILSLFFLIIFLFYNFNFNQEYKHRMLTDITANYEKFKPQEYAKKNEYKYFKYLFYSPHQTVLWITSLNMFYKNKFLGIGPNNFRHECANFKESVSKEFDYCSSHPHSFLFQSLAEIGLLGFIFYCFFLFYLIKELIVQFYKKILRKSIDIPYSFALFVLLINFFPLVPNGNFFGSYLAILNLLPVPFLIYIKNRRNL